MNIEFWAVNQFGRTDFYVDTPATVEALKMLLSRKKQEAFGKEYIVLSARNMEGLKRLGCVFTQKLSPIKNT